MIALLLIKIVEIRNLKRGESLIIAENNKIIIKIISNSLENNLIEGNLKENHEQQLQ